MPRKLTVSEDFAYDKDTVNRLVKKHTRRLALVMVLIPCIFLLRQFIFRPNSAYYYTRAYEYCVLSYSTPFGGSYISSSSSSSPDLPSRGGSKVKNHRDHRLILVSSLQSLTSSAFCRTDTDLKTHSISNSDWRDPLGETKGMETSKYIPWVWDAVFRPGYPYVDILTIDRQECMFNQTELQIARKFQSSSSSSSSSSLSSSMKRMITPQQIASVNAIHSILESTHSLRATCHFYSSESTKYSSSSSSSLTYIGSTNSKEVYMGVMLRCPLPNVLLSRNNVNSTKDADSSSSSTTTTTTTTLSSSLSSSSLSNSDFRIALQWQGSPRQTTTNTFPVCQLNRPPLREQMRKNIDNTLLTTTLSTQQNNNDNNNNNNNSRLKFSLSVCSAIEEKQHGGPSDDSYNIIAWIEYHKVLGIEHFFLYDLRRTTHVATTEMTSDGKNGTNHSEENIQKKIEKYIESGTITIIPWKYYGCVDANNDPLFCEDPLLHRKKKIHGAYAAFTPPGYFLDYIYVYIFMLYCSPSLCMNVYS